MAGILDIANHIQQQGEMGRQRGQQSKLASLAQQAYGSSGDQRRAIIGQAIGTNPDAGFALDKQMGADDDRRNKTLVNMAKMLVSAPETHREALYQHMRPELGRFGIQAPETYAPEVGEVAQSIVAAYSGDEATPSGFREKHLMAEAAGYKAGTPEYQHFMRVQGGTEGRASSAGMQTVMVELPDGRKAPFTFDPRSGNLVPAGAGAARPSGTLTAADGAEVFIDPSVPPQMRAQILASEGITQPPAATSPTPLYGQSPAERAEAEARARYSVEARYRPQIEAATAQAKTDVELSNYDRASALAADRAAQEVAAKAEAERIAEARARLPKMMAAVDETTAIVDKALSHPGRAVGTGASGSYDPRNYLPGNDARDFRVVLDQLKGKAFLQAFESLKGGGAITETEGKKASEAIARLDTAQSDKAFVEALNDLKGVLERARVKAMRSAAGGQPAAGGKRLKFNPATGRVE